MSLSFRHDTRDLPVITTHAVPPSNPADVDVEVLEDLLRRAWEGADPR